MRDTSRILFHQVLCVSVFGALGGLALWSGAHAQERPELPQKMEPQIREALQWLEEIPTGRILLERARERWKVKTLTGLAPYIHFGLVSRTDAVLRRVYDAHEEKEHRERVVSVELKHQPLGDLVLDLSHELTHAVSDPQWDPYDPKLSAVEYLRSVLEGEGGEVDAIHTECRVAAELQKLAEQVQAGRSPAVGIARLKIDLSRCDRYRMTASEASPLMVLQYDERLILKDLYRVGKDYSAVSRVLGDRTQDLPWLSSEKPKLFSSTGAAPYPLSLLREYQAITESACRNTRVRLSSAARSPAQQESSLHHFLSLRCSHLY